MIHIITLFYISSILNGEKYQGKIMSDSKQELLAKKAELEERLERIQNDMKAGLDADWEEQATQLENRDVLMEIARVTEEELQKIKVALQEAE